tara:strand:- start:31552 stop:32184 length:633 start_codon:yes stop_codon:yes gene_type:complete
MSNEFHKQVLIAVGGLCVVHGKDNSDALVRAYEIGLEGLTGEQVAAAAKRSLSSCKWMPKPVELRELAGEVAAGDRALMAYIAVEKAVTRHGGYKSVSFDDVLINAVIRSLGGWQAICSKPTTEFDSFFRPQFLKAYESLTKFAGIQADICRPLIGSHDQHNLAFGIEPTPVVIECGLPKLPNAPEVEHKLIAGKAAAGILKLKGTTDEQ